MNTVKVPAEHGYSNTYRKVEPRILEGTGTILVPLGCPNPDSVDWCLCGASDGGEGDVKPDPRHYRFVTCTHKRTDLCGNCRGIKSILRSNTG